MILAIIQIFMFINSLNFTRLSPKSLKVFKYFQQQKLKVSLFYKRLVCVCVRPQRYFGMIKSQESKGTREWPINWCTSPMKIHKIIPSVDDLNDPTNQNLLKSPKLLCQRLTKRYYKTLEASVINSPLFPSSLNQIQCLPATKPN